MPASNLGIEFPKNISSLKRIQVAGQRENGLVGYSDGEFSRCFGLRRLGLHHIVLPAGMRSSFPHAESLEEEFIYILRGEADVWINGWVHRLTEGHAVGFPAGTGIAHCVLNNSDAPVELLVAGEQTKPGNLCAFPLDPQAAARSGMEWQDAPTQELGPHAGLPGPPAREDFAGSLPPFVAYCPDLPARISFHYPGDAETFGTGARLTNHLGLEALGIWYDVLPRGHRSSWPHAHTHEEEFVFILKGKGKVWMAGAAIEVGPGDGIGFEPGTGMAHCIINDGEEPLVSLVFGETCEFPDEKLTYPLHPLRNLEGRRAGWFWEDAPDIRLGFHSGQPAEMPLGRLRLRLCGPGDEAALLEVMKGCDDYFRLVEGCPPDHAMAAHLLADQPPLRSAAYFKDVFLLCIDGKSVGIAETHGHHPAHGVAYLGMLALVDGQRCNGLGRRFCALIEDYLRRAGGVQSLRLGASRRTTAAGFWEKMGYQANGTLYSWQGRLLSVEVDEYEKSLVP